MKGSVFASLLFVFSLFACTESPKGDQNAEAAVQESAASQKAEPEPCPEVLTVGFYNIENLFDTEDDPKIMDEEYLPNSAKQWTKERYEAKLGKLAEVIAQLGKDDQDGDAVDVLGVCEAENAAVLRDLIQELGLKGKDFELVHYDSPDKRGIDVGLLYDTKRFKPTFTKAYEVDFSAIAEADFRSTLTRNFLVVTGELCGEPAGFIVNHWPSRRGGVAFSSPKREFVAKAVRRVVDSLLEANPSIKLVVMGDFNDTPFDPSIQQVLGADTAEGDLYNTVAYLQAKGIGSHYYHEERSMLDQLIVSRATLKGQGISYIPYSAQRFSPDWLQQDETNGKYAGFPKRTYVGDRYMGGYSDHFPVFLHLKTR